MAWRRWAEVTRWQCVYLPLLPEHKVGSRGCMRTRKETATEVEGIKEEAENEEEVEGNKKSKMT